MEYRNLGKFFLRDSLVRVFLLVFGVLCLLYVLPILTPEQRAPISYYYANLLLIPLLVFCFQYRLREQGRREERIFWHLVSLALGFLWAAKLIQAISTKVYESTVPDYLFAFYYLFLLLAADTRSRTEPEESAPGIASWLGSCGSSILVVGLLLYFVILPLQDAEGGPKDWLPSLAYPVVMDLLLLARFVYLWKNCWSKAWRIVYGLLAFTMFLWIVTDSLVLLFEAGKISWQDGNLADVIGLIPFVPLVLAARIRHFEFFREEPESSPKSGVEWVGRMVRSRNFLVVYAIGFPAMHFGLYVFDVLDPSLRALREVVVFASVLLLGFLVLLDQRLAENRSRELLRDRRQAEEALRSSEERYRALVENSQGLICTHDMEGKLLSVNPASAHLLGYEPEDMVGHNASEFLTPWSLSREEKYYGYLERDRENTGLLKVKTRDGTEQVWVYRSTLVEEPGKEPYVLGHAQDITERIRAEDALRESEAHNRALLGAIPDMMFVIRRDGTLLDFKSSREVEPTRPPEEFLGKKVTETLPRELADRTLDYISRALGTKEVVHYEYELPSSGERNLFEARMVASSEDQVICIVRDITERKRAEDALRRSEEKFRTLMEDAPNAIVITSLDGRIVEINRAVEKMFGHSKNELLGKGIEVLVPERFREAYARRQQAFVSHPEPRPMGTGLELYARRKDGSEFPVEIGLGVFETEEGLLVGATVLDITERKEVEKMKDEFVSMVSHELRTPLTSIRGALGLVSAGLLGNLTEKARHMLEVATNNTDRLVRLLNDILDIHRMEAGRVELVKLECNARELMQSVEEAMHPMAEKAGVSMEIMSVSKPFLADPDRIIQVLTNLMGNAIKFSPAGGRVWLTADCQDGDLLFHVKDEGRGIPLHQQEAIFDRFQQVDASDAREKGGAGLGLAICKKIVEQHGGRIWVESEPDQGSTFSFSLPRNTEQS